MNARDKNYGCRAEAVPQDQPFVGGNDSSARPIASVDQSDDTPAVCTPNHGCFSELLKAMYYWVHSRF